MRHRRDAAGALPGRCRGSDGTLMGFCRGAHGGPAATPLPAPDAPARSGGRQNTRRRGGGGGGGEA
eukprot:161536-Prorocentrum_minimum.AAC.1